MHQKRLSGRHRVARVGWGTFGSALPGKTHFSPPATWASSRCQASSSLSASTARRQGWYLLRRCPPAERGGAGVRRGSCGGAPFIGQRDVNQDGSNHHGVAENGRQVGRPPCSGGTLGPIGPIHSFCISFKSPAPTRAKGYRGVQSALSALVSSPL